MEGPREGEADRSKPQPSSSVSSLTVAEPLAPSKAATPLYHRDAFHFPLSLAYKHCLLSELSHIAPPCQPPPPLRSPLDSCTGCQRLGGGRGRRRGGHGQEEARGEEGAQGGSSELRHRL
eukprot:3066796-Rhodomonas_salina.2